MLRAPRERLVGAHFGEFIPPGQLDEATRSFAALKEVGEGHAREFPLRAADGSIVLLGGGSRANFLPRLPFCVARDISARKGAEEALRLGGARLARAERIGCVGVWEADVGTGEVFWSGEMYRLFGVDPGEFSPTLQALFDAVPEDERAAVRDAAE